MWGEQRKDWGSLCRIAVREELTSVREYVSLKKEVTRKARTALDETTLSSLFLRSFHFTDLTLSQVQSHYLPWSAFEKPKTLHYSKYCSDTTQLKFHSILSMKWNINGGISRLLLSLDWSCEKACHSQQYCSIKYWAQKLWPGHTYLFQQSEKVSIAVIDVLF